MELTREDMAREVIIDLCADGSISYRVAGSNTKRLNGAALPVFTVNTVEEAKDLQVRFGKKQWVEHPDRPGEPWYRVVPFAGSLDALRETADAFKEWYDNRG